MSTEEDWMLVELALASCTDHHEAWQAELVLNQLKERMGAFENAVDELLHECDRGYYPPGYKGQRAGSEKVAPSTRIIVRRYLAHLKDKA